MQLFPLFSWLGMHIDKYKLDLCLGVVTYKLQQVEVGIFKTYFFNVFEMGVPFAEPPPRGRLWWIWAQLLNLKSILLKCTEVPACTPYEICLTISRLAEPWLEKNTTQISLLHGRLTD